MDLRVKAVLFDLDGTLYRSKKYFDELKKAYALTLAKRLSISEKEAHRRLMKAKRTMRSITKSAEALGVTRRELHAELESALDVQGLISPDPRLRYLMMALKHMGLRVGLLTNTGRGLAERVIRQIGLSPEAFDAFLTSSEVEPKPSLKAYAEASRALGVGMAEVLYVGDRLTAEIVPAKRAGMKTALVASGGTKRRKPMADVTIASIYDIVEVVRPPSLREGFAVIIEGIPSSGKTTIAKKLAEELRMKGLCTEVIESDILREFMTPRPTYTEAESRRLYVMLVDAARTLVKAGVCAVVAATWHKREYREMIRRGVHKLFEVYAKCPLEVAMRRDSKGLYAKALRGEIRALPGLGKRFEEPEGPDLMLRTNELSIEDEVRMIVEALQKAFPEKFPTSQLESS